MKSFINDLEELGIAICQILLLYIIIRNIVRAIKGLIARRSSGEAEELERQREAERREEGDRGYQRSFLKRERSH